MFLQLVYQLITAPISRLRAARNRRRALQEIRAMPRHLQEDLGWPQLSGRRPSRCPD